MPYLGQGLDPGLFEPSQPGGRLAVRVTYSRTVPALPGVRITSAGQGTAAARRPTR